MHSWKQIDCALNALNMDMWKLIVDKEWHLLLVRIIIHPFFMLILVRMKKHVQLQENIYTVKPFCSLHHLQFMRLETKRYLLYRHSQLKVQWQIHVPRNIRFSWLQKQCYISFGRHWKIVKTVRKVNKPQQQ